jgi:uncharacterized protein DUF29
MNDLYDDDILLWSERQAELLRRRAAGALVNDAELDWPNIAEEIESVGSEQRHAVESLLTNILQHLLQVMAWPEALAASHWQHEIDGWRVQVERRLRRGPKLRADMEADLANLYQDAIRSMYRELDGVPRPPLPDACPFTLDQLLGAP